MKTVSQAYKAAQSSHLIRPVRKVELFRRVADGSGWESSGIDVTAEVVRLERLSWKLDTEALNEFKASNIRVEVENARRQWDDASSGRFAGFLRFHSKIRISLGLEIAGSPEAFPVFTGVIEDVLEDSGQPTVQLDIRSLDQLLDDADADKAAVLVTNELLGVGDGVRSEFELAQTPAGEVLAVRVGGETVRPGMRWTVSGLNDPQKKAKVRFETVQPAAGAEVRADYRVWERDKQIHQVADALLATVPQVPKLGVEAVHFDPPAQREILHTHVGDFAAYELRRAAVVSEPEPPESDGRLTMKPFDAEAEWLAAVNINRINFKRVANGIHPQWTAQYEADLEPAVERQQIDGNYTFPWQELIPTGTTVSMSGSVRNVVHNSGADYFLINDLDDGGQWNPVPYAPRNAAIRIRFAQISGTVQMETYVRVSGSQILGAKLQFVNLNQVRVVSGGNKPYVNVNLTQWHSFRLVMTPTSATAATYALFVDGVSVQTGSLGSESVIGAITLHSMGTNNFFLDWIRYNARMAATTGELTLSVDYGPQLSGLAAFGLITTMGPFFAELQGAASGAQFYWSWSTDDYTWSAETPVAIGGNIGNWSIVNSPRFIKLRIVLTDTLESAPYGVKRIWLPALAISPAIDGGTGIVSWDTWKANTTPNDGSVQRFTAAFGDGQFMTGSGYSFHRALGPGDAIQTDDFQQSQGFGVTWNMVFITLMNTSGINPPSHDLSVITLTTRDVLITMANYGGRSVLDVLKELARIADFELGLDGEGRFFFRNKAASGTNLLSMDDSNVERIQSFSPGWERVYNSIRATFGDFVRTADSASEGEVSPTSNQRFGIRPLFVGGGNLVFQTDVDLATMMAKRYFGRYKEPKRRATVVARFMPELELGDRVGFSVASPRRIGQAFDARVVGIAHDLMDFRTELDLLEI